MNLQTARDLVAELSKEARKAKPFGDQPLTFDYLVENLLANGKIGPAHLVALGMTSCFSPITPNGPQLVIESYENALKNLKPAN